VEDLLPEPVERVLRLELRVYELRPPQRRTRRDAPVDGALVDDSRVFLDAREDVAAEAVRVEVVVEMRLSRAAERDRRAALAAELQRALAVPRWDVVEHLVCGVLHARLLQVRVPVDDVDELRAALVCTRGDRARQLLFSEGGGDVNDLARLDIGPEVDDQIRKSLDRSLMRRRC
jgi:hypothetical protein